MKFPQDEVLRSFKDVRIYHRCIRRMQTFVSTTSVPSVIFTIGAHTHSTKHCNEIESDPRIQVTQLIDSLNPPGPPHLTTTILIFNSTLLTASPPHLHLTSSTLRLHLTASPPQHHLTPSPPHFISNSPHHILPFHWSTTLLQPVMKYKLLHLKIFENIK